MGLDWIACDDHLRVLRRRSVAAERALFAPGLPAAAVDEHVAARDAAFDAADAYREAWLGALKERGHDTSDAFRANLLRHHVVGRQRISAIGLFFDELTPLEARKKAEELERLAARLRDERRWRFFGLGARRRATVALLVEAGAWLRFWSGQGCHVQASW